MGIGGVNTPACQSALPVLLWLFCGMSCIRIYYNRIWCKRAFHIINMKTAVLILKVAVIVKLSVVWKVAVTVKVAFTLKGALLFHCAAINLKTFQTTSFSKRAVNFNRAVNYCFMPRCGYHKSLFLKTGHHYFKFEPSVLHNTPLFVKRVVIAS